ncbi:hypothetical protein VNO77_07859 [Canavalia gladiata]|uniref:Uncharacterized protein n=1 Tax=Canavalia gladiata TaxID=3824 RepID=A0AAN9QWU6_CANGL
MSGPLHCISLPTCRMSNNYHQPSQTCDLESIIGFNEHTGQTPANTCTKGNSIPIPPSLSHEAVEVKDYGATFSPEKHVKGHEWELRAMVKSTLLLEQRSDFPLLHHARTDSPRIGQEKGRDPPAKIMVGWVVSIDKDG